VLSDVVVTVDIVPAQLVHDPVLETSVVELVSVDVDLNMVVE